MRAILSRKTFGSVPHGAFAGIIPNKSGPRSGRTDRRDVDHDTWSFLFQELWDKRADTEEDALYIHIEDTIEVIFCDL